MYSYERHKSSSSSWHPPVHHIRNFARRHDLPQTSNIPQMNSAQKLGAVLKHTLPLLPTQVRSKVEAPFAPEALALLAGMAGVWAASHAVGIGEVIDLVLLGVGITALGTEVVTIAQDLVGFVNGVLQAQTEADLEKAAEHLARAVAVVGVDVVAAVLTHQALKQVKAQQAAKEVEHLSTPEQTVEQADKVGPVGVPNLTLLNGKNLKKRLKHYR
ncbi:hypothetical protein [Anthocerotibacter panamensis]|uniref:hypothetical protein n=1 Tax=Anthocerotibacter panamensis TaxID=2857077 RepID=UPI001C40660F|nr:hypothetical protein [Anthocerotibacter panamensis]